MEKKPNINNKRKGYTYKQLELNSSFERKIYNNTPKFSSNIHIINGKERELNNKYKLYSDILFDDKIRDGNSPNNKKNITSKVIKIENNINDFNNYDNNVKNGKWRKKEITGSKSDNKINLKFFSTRNNSMNNMMSTKTVNSNNNKNSDNIVFSNNNNIMLIDKNTSYNSERLDVRNVIKINKLKDDYIDFLKKEYEDKSKNNTQLDINNKELLKKCDKLIYDNHILSDELTDRANKLNKIVQENTLMKAEYDKSMINLSKLQQKIKLYEDQLNLFKSNNENYQKIIRELKLQNEQLNKNLNKMKNSYEDKLKKQEDLYKNEIEDMKINIAKLYDNKIQEEKKNETKIKALTEEIKELNEKNKILEMDLKDKQNVIELMYKDNEKLNNDNKNKNFQIEQRAKQIEDLKSLIQHKENLINTIRIDDKTFLNKSNSYSFVKLDGSEILSENLTRLINDNEDNRMKIEVLNNRMKSIAEIRKKYNSLIKEYKTFNDDNKIPYNLLNNSLDKINNNTYNNSKNIFPIKSELKKINNMDLSQNDIPIYNRNNTYKGNTTINAASRNYKNFLNKKELRNFATNSEYKENTFDDIKIDNNRKYGTINNTKNNKIIKTNIKENNKEDLKINKIKSIKKYIIDDIEKKPKTPESFNIFGKSGALFKGRNYYKNGEKKNKKMEEDNNEEVYEKDESKDFDQFKLENNTYRPNYNFYKEEIFNIRNNNGIMISAENEDVDESKYTGMIYYLYGIDRNDYLHSFDINNKRWLEKKKIYEINLDDKSNTFKKDYQYEGTLLYNTLEGIYILTGENTDILYYFNSKTNMITKICKFNNSHNNGSIMFDENSNCLYVFGGKKINSCEYYSFNDKKIYKLPNLISDRANSSFIISNNKIFGFFGFSYEKNDYVKTIEYIDFYKKDRWFELNNIKLLKNDIFFDVESISTMYYKHNKNLIFIYSGIQGQDEDFITEYYLLYDVKNNTMDKINKWELNQYKYMGKKWREYEMKETDPNGFHFAKNTRFILMPEDCIPLGYNRNDLIDVMIDYKNNVHFINQEKQKIDIYRGAM